MSGYSEDALVKQPAIALLAELGWETRAEVILTARLHPPAGSHPFSLLDKPMQLPRTDMSSRPSEGRR